MQTTNKIPVIREDDGELFGFISQDSVGWLAQTIFGYTISHVESRAAAERIVREEGLSILTGVWQYFDKDDRTWHPCVLQEVYENKVTVIRTNSLGFQDPDDYKRVTITNPSETNLVKS